MSSEVAVQPTNGSIERSVAPPVDVFESGNEILIVADIPGVPNDAVDIRVDHDTLTLEAKRRPDHASPALAREYSERTFARAFRIPAGIDTANIQAEAKQGTLVVRLPKAAASKSRRIAVK
jgi:HSP20 family protein